MKVQSQIDYSRIEKAIEFVMEHHLSHPALDEIALHVGLSPAHFQKLFKDWVGISPKKFLQFMSLDYAKSLLRENLTVLEVTHELGLSSSGRLHDLFVSIEGMTPGEYKLGGAGQVIKCTFSQSPFGKLIVASTKKGVCFFFFCTEDSEGLEELRSSFPQAQFINEADDYQRAALSIFDDEGPLEIKLHLAGTPFQIKVWECLLKIPSGNVTTYQQIAEITGNSNSSRAVEGAVGKNPIALIIPCHRVIRASGLLGGYRWGLARKSALLGWEATKREFD